MQHYRKISTAITLLALSIILGITTARADSSTPVNSVSTSISPVTTVISCNYDFLTGTLTPGTATATTFTVGNVLLTRSSDPSPPDLRNGATFFGTARPVHFQGDTVVFEQSACPTGTPVTGPTCFTDGTFTFGGFVMRHVQGDTLDQLTNLQALYYIQSPSCDGGGSPRFQIDMSNGGNIFVYFGSYPNFTDCTPTNTWTSSCPTSQCALSSNNMASDFAGLRWDDSQLTPCGTFYQTYSQAVTCANSLGLTISSVSIITDGGWSGTNNGPTGGGQTFYFQNIQVNQVTRFP